MSMQMRAGVALAACLFVPGMATTASAQAPAPRTVLTLHLGAATFPSNPILDAGIREELATRPDVPVACYSEYLDSDLFPSDQATLAFKDYIRRKYADRKIDVVIASTDTMLSFALANRAELFPAAPIVFFSLAPPDKQTRSAGPGATGMSVGVAYVQTLNLALSLHPGTERVYVIANNADGRTASAVRTHLTAFASRVAVTYLTQNRLVDLLAAVRAIPSDGLVLYIWHSEVQPGHVMYPDAIARLVAEAAPVPVYGTSDIYIGTGVVGGVVRSTSATGTELGTLALRILTGTRAQDIPMETARVEPVIDWRQVRRWGIAPSRLPSGSRILFRAPTVWERYRGYVIAVAAALVAQTVLIAALLIQRVRRRQADTALRASYERVRQLGSRLLTAQETERARIARELHDDVSQQLAVLKIELTVLMRKLHGDAEATAGDATRRADQIAATIRSLSHMLHPPRLRVMGLVSAISGLQSELARPGVRIDFTHHDVPTTLPSELSVSLFRVAQEGLQNALKYSGAHAIAVNLWGSVGELVLTIADDGVGFDAGAASNDGLGLISVRERAEAFGGTVEIHSSPGKGTSLELRVPFPETQSAAALL